MNWTRLLLVGVLLAGLVSETAAAEPYLKEELRIPFALAGPRGLEALLVRPNEPGRYPLALIAHGSPRSAEEHPKDDSLGDAAAGDRTRAARLGGGGRDATRLRRFRRRRDGAATDPAPIPTTLPQATAGAADLKASIDFLVDRPDIDRSRVISVGVSAGGFATVALTADPPPELVAAISFAGGRGSKHDDQVCHEERLIEAFRLFGKRSRIPMLWVYAENDHFFGPALAQQLKDAFTEGGGDVEFIAAPAFGRDGHRLFSMAGIPLWSGFVDAFLRRHDLKSVRRRCRRPIVPPLPCRSTCRDVAARRSKPI